MTKAARPRDPKQTTFEKVAILERHRRVGAMPGRVEHDNVFWASNSADFLNLHVQPVSSSNSWTQQGLLPVLRPDLM